MRTLRPMRADAGMTARLPTMVMPVFSRSGSFWLGDVVESAPVPTTALGPMLDLLVDDGAVDDGAGPDDRVEHDHAVAHDGTRVDPARRARGPSARPCRR